MVRIGFIGSGNMAQAMIKAILDKGISDSQGLIASDKNEEKLKEVGKQLEIEVTPDNNEVVKKSDITFVAVKPQDIEAVLKEIKDSITQNKILVSIAAGVRLDSMVKILGSKKIVRIMPNAPCVVASMAAGYVCRNLTENEKSTIQIIFDSFGTAIELPEEMLDAVTGLSGSGPAFVAYFIQAFKEAGIENGLSEDVSYKLALKTFEGTAKLLYERKINPDELIKIVSSPGGTTIAGRDVLENSDVKEILNKTVKRATERSRELGR
jgi:pyrroline-5-carboxylate reductase